MSLVKNKSGFLDTKDFRKNILNKAYERLGVIIRSKEEGNGTQVNKNRGLLSLLDSYYKSDVPSTNYAMHLKAIAFESARALIILEKARDDIYFNSLRGEYLSQNLGSFLFPFSRLSTTEKTDNEARNFYLSIIEAYFGGSTKENIENSLVKFLQGVKINILENFILAKEEGILDPIINKFTFDVLININDPRIRNINQVQADVEFLLSIVKPAHTFFSTKFIFNEFLDSFRNICTMLKDMSGLPLVTHDGFEIKIKGNNTAICDTKHIDYFDYYYEDIRKPFDVPKVNKIENEIIQLEDLNREIPNFFQASPRVPYSNFGGNWDKSNPNTFHTKYGPFGKSDGNLAESVEDIIVTVNGEPVELIEIFPLSAAFTLKDTPPENAIIQASYYVLKNYIGGLITNEPDSVINNFRNYATEHFYSNVLLPTGYTPIGEDQEFPIWEEKFRYKGFDLFNSSVLNSPLTLNFNEPNSRSKLNDYSIVKSKGYDFGDYPTNLQEGTPIFPKSLELPEVLRRLKSQEFVMNISEFNLNKVEDRLFGEIHQFSYHSFLSSLEIDSINNNGNKGFLKPIGEEAIGGFQLDLSRTFKDTIKPLGREFEDSFYASPLTDLFAYNKEFLESNFSSSGFSACDVPASGVGGPFRFLSLTNTLDDVLLGGAAGWEVTNSPTRSWGNFDSIAKNYPLDVDLEVNYNFGGNYSQYHLLYNDTYHEFYTSLTAQDSFPDVIADTKNIPFGNLFTMNAIDQNDESVFKLKDISKGFTLTFRSNRSILTSDSSSINIVEKNIRITNEPYILNEELETDLSRYNIESSSIVVIGLNNRLYELNKDYTIIESGDPKLTKISRTFNSAIPSGSEVYISYDTANTSIRRVNNLNKKILTYTNDGELNFNTIDSSFGLGSDIVSSIFIEPNSKKIYATTKEGLSISNNGFISFINIPYPTIIKNSLINDIFVDKNQKIFLCTKIGLAISEDQGLNYFFVNGSQNLKTNILSCFVDSSDVIYLGTDSGLRISYDGYNFENFNKYQIEENSEIIEKSLIRVKKITSDLNNKIYLSTDDGVIVLESNSEGILFSRLDSSNNISSNIINSVNIDSLNNLYVSTPNGLNISNNGGISFFNIYESNGLGSDFVYKVDFNQFGKIYAATRNGLSFSTDGGQTFTTFTEEENLISNIVTDLNVLNGKIYCLKSVNYDLENMIVMGDKIFKLDENNPRNINIGYDVGDDVVVNYKSITRMNDNFELVLNIFSNVELKYITKKPIDKLISVFNVTKNKFYDITNHTIFGEYIVNLDKEIEVNKEIGFDINDEIKISYTSSTIEKEIAFASILYGDYLKFKLNTNNLLTRLIRISNLSRGIPYEITNYRILNPNIFKLDDGLPQNATAGISETDVISVEFLSNTGTITVTDELVESVLSPARFRFFNNKSVFELFTLTNVNKQKRYDLTDTSVVTVSTGDLLADNILIKGDNSLLPINTNNRWNSISSTDDKTETIDIIFNYPRNIDRITLFDHNWKEYEITYESSQGLVHFDDPILVEDNIDGNTTHKFKQVTTDRIFIKIFKTIIPNDEKYLHKISYFLEEIIELDYTSVENHRVGLDYGDVVYSNTTASNVVSNIEPWMTFPRQYNGSVFEIYPV
jgi:hypothetical protein